MHDNKSTVRRFFDELWNQRRIEIADELFSRECQTHQLRSGAPTASAVRGPEEMKAHVGQWLAAFPDLRFEVDQMMEDGDRVFTQCVMQGTHNGNWLGLPPTGRFISIRMMVVQRVSAGKIVEDWVPVDFLGVFQQLGLVPSTQELFTARMRPYRI